MAICGSIALEILEEIDIDESSTVRPLHAYRNGTQVGYGTGTGECVKAR